MALNGRARTYEVCTSCLKIMISWNGIFLKNLAIAIGKLYGGRETTLRIHCIFYFDQRTDV